MLLRSHDSNLAKTANPHDRGSLRAAQLDRAGAGAGDGRAWQSRVKQGNRCCIWNCWSLDLRIPLHLAETEANEAKQFKKAKQIRESLSPRGDPHSVIYMKHQSNKLWAQLGAAGGSCMPTDWLNEWLSECVNEWMNEFSLLLFACWMQRASFLYLRVFRSHSCSHSHSC